MSQRKIVQIDESKCDGCGLCVSSCAEGAIQIVGGKARLVSDVYCDGLGACLGECPQGAIAIVDRDAAAFDEAAAHRHVAQIRESKAAVAVPSGGCPGSRVQDLRLSVLPPGGRPASAGHGAGDAPAAPSALGNWPIQLHLVPPGAPFLQDADLLLAADCVPFALADFHERYLQGRPVVIACPKLDNTQPYVEKLAAMFTLASIRSLTVVHMEVPCCMGLMRIAQAARQAAGVEVPLHEVVISTRGNVLRESDAAR
jgi:Pyruvate/2-oxoacid:ferredoxin oxidoreductase delta subunit